MVRVKNYGKRLKREKEYFKAVCNHCEAEIVFEYNDIWFDNAMYCIGRVECPICRTKVFMNFEHLSTPKITSARFAAPDEYETANKDVSKRGIQQLIDEKKQEVKINENVN